MRTVNVREARATFSALLDAVAGGERITITRDGRAVAEMGPPQPNRDPGPLYGPTGGREAAQRRQAGIDGILGQVNRGRRG